MLGSWVRVPAGSQKQKPPHGGFSVCTTFARNKLQSMDFQNKVVVITGGSDGIGKALVELFLSKGAKGRPVAVITINYMHYSSCLQASRCTHLWQM